MRLTEPLAEDRVTHIQNTRSCRTSVLSSYVLESFADLFVDAPTIQFSITDTVRGGVGSIAIHTVREEVHLDGQVISSMVATNIFQCDGSGSWRMVLHHSSHEPDMHVDEFFDDLDFEDFDDDHDVPPVLH